MIIAASFTTKSAILSFVITHELLTMRLFLDSLANLKSATIIQYTIKGRFMSR